MKLHNPPAFPSPTAPSVYGAWGMTLRDYFASSALTAVILHTQKALNEDGQTMFFSNHEGDEGDAELVAQYSYAIADALLRARDPSAPQLAATAETGDAIHSDWDVRGALAAGLTCWHRLTGTEADELVALYQSLIIRHQAAALRAADQQGVA